MTDRLSTTQLQTETAFVQNLARVLVHANDADDVAQETWLRTLRGESPQGDAAGERRWLGGIARNVAREWRRRHKTTAEGVTDAAGDDADPLEATARFELVHALVTELQALPSPYRETLICRFYDGQTPREIARRQGVPAARVRSRLHRGLAMLRARMDACHGSRREWCEAYATVAALSGAWTVKKGVTIVAAALLLTFAGSWAWESTGNDETMRPQAAAGTPTPNTAESPHQPTIEPDEPAPRFLGEDDAAPAADGPRLRVVDLMGEPVKGASVQFVDLFAAQHLELGHLARFADWPAQWRSQRETDGTGEVFLPTFVAEARVTVSASTGWTSQIVRSAPELLIVIEPDRTLPIRVVDDRGDPAGDVPVALLRRSADWQQTGEESWPMWSGRTDANGLAIIEHVGWHLTHEMLGGEIPPWSDFTPVVIPDFPLGSPTQVALIPDALPDQVTLQLPPAGSVRLHLTDQDGNPVNQDLQFSSPRSDREIHVVNEGSGIHLIERVEVAARFPLAVLSIDGRFDYTATTIDGPARRGGIRDIEWTLVSRPMLHATVTTSSGSPVAGQRLLACWASSSPTGGFESAFPSYVTTNARGEMNLALPAAPFLGEFWVRLHPESKQGETLHGVISIEIDETDGSFSRTIELEPTTAPCTGVVVDEQGRPLPGLQVTPVVWTGDRLGPVLRHLSPAPRAARLGPTVITDPDGAFELLFSSNGLASFAVQVHHPSAGHWFASVPTPATPLSLTLPQLPQLFGRVLLDEGVPTNAITVRLRRGGRRARPVSRSSLTADGGYSLRGLHRAGRGSIDVTLTGYEGAALVDPVEVQLPNTGEVFVPDIDLRGQLCSASVVVTGAGGERIRQPIVAVAQHSDGETWYEGPFTAAGAIPVVWPGADRVDLIVGAPGYRSQSLTDVAGQIEVELTTGIEVLIQPDSWVDLAPGELLSAHLAGEHHGGVFPTRTEPTSLANDGIRAWVDAPGQFEVTWVLHRNGRSFPFDAAGTIEIVEANARQVFQLSFESGSFAEAHQHLERRD